MGEFIAVNQKTLILNSIVKDEYNYTATPITEPGSVRCYKITQSTALYDLL